MIGEKMALTVDEAAEFTGIGRNTMRQLVEWRMVPVIRVGRKILIPTNALMEFLKLNHNIDLRNKSCVQPWKEH